MVILALDTSSAHGSAAAIHSERDGVVTIDSAGDATRSHAERLPIELMAVLADAGTAIDEVNLLAVVVGPGSFTGLRVGIATIQGLALARGLLVVPVTAFEALAWHAAPGHDATALWVEAHRGEVFATLLAADGRTVLSPPTALTPTATLDAWAERLGPFASVQFLGDGAVRYQDTVRERLGATAHIDARHAAPVLAGAAAAIAKAAPERAVRPHALVPLYVRRPDVEIVRDRRILEVDAR